MAYLRKTFSKSLKISWLEMLVAQLSIPWPSLTNNPKSTHAWYTLRGKVLFTGIAFRVLFSPKLTLMVFLVFLLPTMLNNASQFASSSIPSYFIFRFEEKQKRLRGEKTFLVQQPSWIAHVHELDRGYFCSLGPRAIRKVSVQIFFSSERFH